jgi:ribosomal-protein-alanine N-acetyltransferase
MKAKLSTGHLISDITIKDKNSYVTLLQDREIYERTLNIPYPYRPEDADDWLTHVSEQTKQFGKSLNWAIRNPDGELIGGIGFHNVHEKSPHKAEIGYWLAKKYWGQGIVSAAVKEAVDFGFKKLKLSRITANVFAFNIASAQVLIKNGFQLEGFLKKAYYKDAQFFDGILFAKLRD